MFEYAAKNVLHGVIVEVYEDTSAEFDARWMNDPSLASAWKYY